MNLLLLPSLPARSGVCWVVALTVNALKRNRTWFIVVALRTAFSTGWRTTACQLVGTAPLAVKTAQRMCMRVVPDPVGLLDCVENRVDLPYMAAWVECTNSLGENVATSRDIINYRCKSVWEGKGVIPEVFYIKDCVIEKMGLPGPNVSAIILGAYKECERSAPPTGQQKKNTPAQPNTLLQQQVIPAGPQIPSTQFKPPSSRQYFMIYPVALPANPVVQPQYSQQPPLYQKKKQMQFSQQQGTQNQLFQQTVYQQQRYQQQYYPQQVIQQQNAGRPVTQPKNTVYQIPYSNLQTGPYYYQFTSTHPKRKI